MPTKLNGPIVAPADPLVGRLCLRERDMADALGVTPRTLFTWRESEGLPYVRVGSVVMYPVAAVRRWLRGRTEAAAPAVPEPSAAAAD